ncbi:unnamed protein product [Bursaphelenchus xylophilus]|uniref:(pine wood nematode) hypothetical protein n=1 Tax=Bursaphelenchus xylophilus TaxID=6326 RepID=A0A1I7RM77_BURXY|nr:unnamed protein product [Bursaphelenchus xylophilus]CAG9118272.1 unnamed protein product [Bursaphelenchus xylophilus]
MKIQFQIPKHSKTYDFHLRFPSGHYANKRFQRDMIETFNALDLTNYTNEYLNLTEEVCDPFYVFKNAASLCRYVEANQDACSSGGYPEWTHYALCTEALALRYGLWVPLAILYMIMALMILGTASDEYLCSSISVIVNQLKISQNVAGVTLMAFGNGAPDIFGMLVEVVAAESPKADLALGQLLGGGMFVTTVVLALIILHKPFKVMRRPMIRDLSFYLIALAWLVFVIMYDSRMYYWQPMVLLLLYVIYAGIVIFGSGVRNGKFLCFRWQTVPKSRISSRRLSRKRSTVLGGHIVELAISTVGPEDGVAVTVASCSPGKISPVPPKQPRTTSFNNGLLTVDCGGINKHRSTSTLSRRSNITIVPVGEPDDDVMTPRLYRDHGKFFTDEVDSDDTSCELVEDALDNASVTSSSPNTSYGSITPITDEPKGILKRKYNDYSKKLKHAYDKWYEEKMANEPWYGKVIACLRLPCGLILWATTPSTNMGWNKCVAVLHCFASPIFVLFAFEVATMNPHPDGPDLWVYCFVVSTILAIAVYIITSEDKEPKYLKYIQPYTSFIVSVAWVYWMAAEIVNVVMMIGVVSRISHVVLGLTVLAWSNSLGDVVADLAVAKQGFPRMAISAVFGGPLLNLLMGYGLSFMIACLKGRHPIKIDQGNLQKLLMIFFLCFSLISTMVFLVVQKFHTTRLHAYFLLALYAVFIGVNLLVESHVISL